MTSVSYFFDPACPWTWGTTKWLRRVEEAQGIDIQWRAFSLLVLNGDDVPPQHAEALNASHASLRVVEALARDGRQDKIVEFYDWLGTKIHEENSAGFDSPMALIEAGVETCGLSEYVSALSDESLDAVVEESTNLAIAAAGPDIGSPVITFDGIERVPRSDSQRSRT